MTPTDETRILVPAGALGAGVRADEVAAGVALSPHAIALDAGSTDSGPAYLASGKSKYSRAAVKRDLAVLMAARREAGIPLLIGSCGTSGCDMALDWTLDIVLEVTREQGSAPRIAVLYSEQDKAMLRAKAAAGAVRALAPMGPLAPRWRNGVHGSVLEMFGPNPETFGHCGWGGAFGCADAENRMSMGYVINQMGERSIGDPRGLAFSKVVYESL
jgi:CubicO group peptidase (beta-lactamase class C family)